MDERVKREWVAELRSGKWAQGRERLNRGGETKDGGTHCCLGVLSEIAVREGVIEKRLDSGCSGYSYGTWSSQDMYRTSDVEENYLPKAVQEWAGLDDLNPRVKWDGRVDSDWDDDLTTLAKYNDNGGYSFEDIADMVERDL